MHHWTYVNIDDLMKIYIKNMVCDRCKMVIKTQLNDLNIFPESIELGEVNLSEQALGKDQLKKIKAKIEPLGFELLDDKTSQIIDKIRTVIIELVHHKEEAIQLKFSEYLKSHLSNDYNYLSNLFSSVEGVTIENYLIQQKIEKAKELLIYNELNLNEISYQLGYSSVAHLSNQFKKVTGLTPSHFKKLKDSKKRSPLDKL